MFSIVILTYNEEQEIEACLQSVEWADDVLVFDSFSTDLTVERALACGARVIQNRFENYASQRQASLSQGNFKYQWVFMLDADERFTPGLRIEIEHELANVPVDRAIYRLRRKDYFNGVWIRSSGGYPTWFGRLLRVGQVSILRAINEQYETDGSIGLLQQHIEHFPFNKGIERWIDRHNDYSRREALAMPKERLQPVPWRKFFSRDPADRRAAMKSVYCRMPARPLMVFLYLYLWRRGFLEGRSGYHYASLRMSYEVMIDVKCWLREQNLGAGRPPAE